MDNDSAAAEPTERLIAYQQRKREQNKRYYEQRKSHIIQQRQAPSTSLQAENEALRDRIDLLEQQITRLQEREQLYNQHIGQLANIAYQFNPNAPPIQTHHIDS